VAVRGVRLAPPPSTLAPRAPRRPAGEGARALGTAVHAELQRLAESGLLRADGARLRLALRQAGVAGADLDAAQREALAALERTLADPRGRWLLGAHEEARCEWRLAGMVGGELVHATLDRSFVENGERWIVDYKLATPQAGASAAAFLDAQTEQYRPQLERYATLAAALEGRPVRCGLYFPMWAGWREVGEP
ncbi:MAG: PD-(D/E)XK nuclease family protein, partial [Terriglobales bacterium]